jgi:predicted esterase
MPDNAIETFDNLQDEIFRLHGENAFKQAIELLNREGGRFVENQARILFWKLCFHSLNGETDLALQTLADGLDRGLWYGETWLRADPDLKPLQGNPEFERLVAISIERARELAAQTTPTRLDIAPGGDAIAPYPLLIALHANNSSAQLSVDYWRPATEQGWSLSLPMSTQAASSDTARWDEEEWATRDVQYHYREIMDQQSIDPERVAIGGFSMGGRQALMLGLTGAIQVKGVIALGPALGESLDGWMSYLEAAKKSKLRVSLIVGDMDHPPFIYHPTIRLAEVLNQHEIPCQLKVYPGMKHEFPPDFAEILPEMLAWIMD